MNIAIAFDQNFVTPFYVLLTSIFYNNKDCRFYFHVIVTGVNDVDKNRIKQYVNDNNSLIEFYDINKIQGLEEIYVVSEYWTVASYYRLFFVELVPKEITKLLYLDTDIVVNGSLVEIFNINMEGYSVGAVIDSAMRFRPELELGENFKYFNSGVLMMNLIQWRKDKITEKVMEVARNAPEKLIYPDQDALNIVLNGKWLQLDKKYNVMYPDVPFDLQLKDLKKFSKDKKIIHFTGVKPWKPLCTNRLKYLYKFYFEKSPKVSESYYDEFRYNWKFIMKFIKIKVAEMYFEYPAIVEMYRKLKR